MSGSFETGWYGKLPANGDFVTRRLPPSFIEPWDAWLNAMLAGSRERLGPAWRDAFLSAPAWRFVLAPGIIGDHGWAGLIVPSVDSVGRYFPITVASALPSQSMDPVTTVVRAHNWYGEVEPVAYAALSPDAEMETFDAQLRNRSFPEDLIAIPESTEETVPPRSRGQRALWIPLGSDFQGEAGLRGLAKPLAEPYSAWLAEESEIFGRSLMLCEKLPAVDQFCAMLNGEWISRPGERRSA
ncbi:MAG TPA: type VI secretion system-associated protein TagF [Burkholderiales bacterium]|nr:type VI secretion system-associated protein TagF [Burkholderiales bacterium]